MHRSKLNIREFKAFCDIASRNVPVSPALRSSLQCAHVSFLDASSTELRKDLADKMLVVHLFAFALDHAPPATIVLISGYLILFSRSLLVLF